MRLKRSTQSGFTLVELMIVVIILSILAAIVVPQFVGSTDDAKDSALDSTLANMRAAIDFYYQQHGHYPSAVTDGTNAADMAETFVAQLTLFTNSMGVTMTTMDTDYKYGPYLRKADLPQEPFTESNTLVVTMAGSLPLGPDSPDMVGWKFDNQTGQFIVNHSMWSMR